MTISVSVDVIAATEEEALAKAIDSPVFTLCNHCSSGDSGEWFAGELDGEVKYMMVVRNPDMKGKNK